jgi:hypothetical protein
LFHQDPDISFQIPDNWQNKCITAFAAPLEPGQTIAPNVVVTRDLLPPDRTARDYADSQLVELSKRLEAFTLRKRNEFVLQGHVPAVALDFTWRSNVAVLRQWTLFYSAQPGQVLSMVFTALETDFPQIENQFAALVNSIQFSA